MAIRPRDGETGRAVAGLTTIMCVGFARLDFDRVGGSGANGAQGGIFTHHSGHVALALTNALDFDGDCIDALLESRQAVHQLGR